MRGVIFLFAVLCAANAAAVVKLGTITGKESSLQDCLLMLFLADGVTILGALCIVLFVADKDL